MVNLKGLSVTHEMFGKGIVQSVRNGLINVEFGRTLRQFPYPSSIGKFLTFEDPAVHERMISFVEGRKVFFCCGAVYEDIHLSSEKEEEDPARVFLTKEEAFADMKRRIDEYYLWLHRKDLSEDVLRKKEKYYRDGSDDPERVKKLSGDSDSEEDRKLLEELTNEGALIWEYDYFADKNLLRMSVDEFCRDMYIHGASFFVATTSRSRSIDAWEKLYSMDKNTIPDLKHEECLTVREWKKWLAQGAESPLQL